MDSANQLAAVDFIEGYQNKGGADAQKLHMYENICSELG